MAIAKARRYSPYSKTNNDSNKAQSNHSRSFHTTACPPFLPSSANNLIMDHRHDNPTFTLENGSSYTIFPGNDSPENHWAAIYQADWIHPLSTRKNIVAIKAADFTPQSVMNDDPRAEYRRPRKDFEREVHTFLHTNHKNILKMYDYWEWEEKGYIAMKKMKGSLGDVLFDEQEYGITEELRSNESVLAELIRQVYTPSNHTNRRFFKD
jgi:serine/threonine protein kinase